MLWPTILCNTESYQLKSQVCLETAVNSLEQSLGQTQNSAIGSLIKYYKLPSCHSPGEGSDLLHFCPAMMW